LAALSQGQLFKTKAMPNYKDYNSLYEYMGALKRSEQIKRQEEEKKANEAAAKLVQKVNSDLQKRYGHVLGMLKTSGFNSVVEVNTKTNKAFLVIDKDYIAVIEEELKTVGAGLEWGVNNYADFSNNPIEPFLTEPEFLTYILVIIEKHEAKKGKL
jgi:hypothetical protein